MFDAGALFGKYRITSLIGRGGMGTVYLAEDTTLGRRIALKVLDRAFAESPEFEKRFLREARTIAGLQHPNIVPIHAMEKTNNILAIEMPYIDGGSLAGAMDGAKKDPALCVSCVHDALMALARCHAEGIIHRDVKPSNILLRADGVALLSDFGLAKVAAEQESVSISSGSSSGFFLGTPRYAPPESWDGQSPEPNWDIYSAGMILYEAFAPNPPYTAATLIGLVKQVVEKPVAPLAEVAQTVSKELSDAVGAMLHREPAQRPADASAALERLNEAPEWKAYASGGARTIALRASKAKPPRRTRPRLSLRVQAAIAVAILAVAALFAFLAGRATSPGETVGMQTPAAPPVSVSPFVVLDTVDPGEGTVLSGHVLLLAPEHATTWHTLACESTEIWMFDVTAQASGVFQIEGNWAGYSDRAATLFQHGEIVGSGRWTVPNVEMTASLDFRNVLDGTRRTRALIFKRAAEELSDTDYVNRIAASDFFQPLLYNEILPRRLAWGRDLESRFLSRTALTVGVPALSADDGAIVVDGNLSESAWPSSALDAEDGPGAVVGEGNGAAHLFVRSDEKGLYVAVRVPAVGNAPHLRIALMPVFTIPVNRSPRWSVLIGQDGIITSRYKKGDKASVWQCPWTAASLVVDALWQAEVYIPFDSLDGVPVPAPGDRWRMNCSVAQGAEAESVPQARWGASDISQIQQGLILVFGAL